MSYFLPLLRVHIILCFFLPLALNAQNEFEQAFAPIVVGGITIFVPLELHPDVTTYLTIKETPAAYLLQWTENSDSNYYVLERYVNNRWQLVANNIATNEYRVDKNGGDVFRIKGCHQYGCSGWTNVNNINRLPLQIASFYTSDGQVEEGEEVVISWDVLGASVVNLKINNTNYNSLPFSGDKRLTVYGYTVIELSAAGFGDTQSQKSAIVVHKHKTAKTTQISGHLQPLKNLNLDIVQRTVLTSDEHTYVATHDGFLYKITNNEEIVWKKKLNGVIVNKPILNNGSLYYSVGAIDNTGEMCKTAVSTTTTQCQKVSGTLISSPVIKNIDNNNRLNSNLNRAMQASNTVSLKATPFNNNVFSITTKGLITEYDPVDLSIKNTYQLPSLYKNNPILSDAAISKNNELVLRTAEKQVTAFIIPSTMSAKRSFFSSVQRFFAANNDEIQNTEPKVLDIAWQKEL